MRFRWNKPEEAAWGSALRCWSVGDLELDGFDGRKSLGSGKPAVWLEDVERAYVHCCRAPEGTQTFLHLGAGTGDVTLVNNELSRVASSPANATPRVFAANNRLRDE